MCSDWYSMIANLRWEKDYKNRRRVAFTYAPLLCCVCAVGLAMHNVKSSSIILLQKYVRSDNECKIRNDAFIQD